MVWFGLVCLYFCLMLSPAIRCRCDVSKRARAGNAFRPASSVFVRGNRRVVPGPRECLAKTVALGREGG